MNALPNDDRPTHPLNTGPIFFLGEKNVSEKAERLVGEYLRQNLSRAYSMRYGPPIVIMFPRVGMSPRKGMSPRMGMSLTGVGHLHASSQQLPGIGKVLPIPCRVASIVN